MRALRIFTVEDETLLLAESERIIKEAAPEAEVLSFSSAKEALEAAKEKGRAPDVVFSDIQMPEMNGMELAEKLREVCPNVKTVFVTGYDHYAVQAYRMHAEGYIMKPLRAERVREELEVLGKRPGVPKREKLEVHCFGDFAVFWKGRPVLFARKQTKELFAYVVDKNGRLCTAEEIITALWETVDDMAKAKTRIRNLVRDLRKTFEDLGIEDIIIRRSGLIAVARDRLNCDYYRLLDGDKAAAEAFRGEYMNQYSWAEETQSRLYFDIPGADREE